MRSKKEYTNHNIKSTKTIKSVQEKFDTWRKKRDKRGRIPDYLWAEATRLCRRYTVSQVAGLLHLNYQALKKRYHDSLECNPGNSNSKHIEKRSLNFFDVKIYFDQIERIL